MKKTWMIGPLAAVALVVLAVPTRSTMVVWDPGNNATQITNFVKGLAQWAQNFSNQMMQYTQLVNQVRQYAAYLKMFGDPQQLVGALGLSQLGQSLGLYDIAQAYGSIQSAVTGTKALTDSANGLYNDVIRTPEGFTRNWDNYRVYEFQNNLRNTYQSSAQNYTQTGEAIKNEIAETQRQLDQASTATAIAKLNGKMNALIAQQQSLSGELQRNAFNSMVAANDAQNHRQMVQKANADVMGATITQSRASLEETRFSSLTYGNVDIEP